MRARRSLPLICLLNYSPMIKQFSWFYLSCRWWPQLMHSKWWLWCFDCKLFSHCIQNDELWTWTRETWNMNYGAHKAVVLFLFSVHDVNTQNKASQRKNKTSHSQSMRGIHKTPNAWHECHTDFRKMCLPSPPPPPFVHWRWRSIRFRFVSHHPIHPSVSTFYNGLVKTVLCTIFKCSEENSCCMALSFILYCVVRKMKSISRPTLVQTLPCKLQQ